MTKFFHTQRSLPISFHLSQSQAAGQFAHAGNYWIGANDNGQEGYWKWTDGTPVTDYSWGWGEPNGGPLVNCVHVNYGGIGKWDDAPCGESKPYVCQRCSHHRWKREDRERENLFGAGPPGPE